MGNVKTSSAVVILRDIPSLSSFSNERLVNIALHSTELHYDPGEIIYREGDTADSLLIITAGRCNILKGEELIAVRSKGDIIGEMSLLEQRPRFATVQAGDAGLDGINVPFDSFFQNDDKEMRLMLATLSRKLREAQDARLREIERQKNELEGLVSLQAAFLSMVRHELVTPVSNAQLSLEVIRKSNGLTTELRSQVDATQRAVDLARRKILTLIEYSSLIGQQGTIQLQPADFLCHVDIAIQQCFDRATMKGLTVTHENKTGQQTLILECDRRYIREAVTHLLDNAIKYTPGGGKIATMVWIDDDKVFFRVADTGIGISPDKLDSLWEPFQQVTGSLRRGEDGLGMGLALVKFIVKAHGGDVWGKSVPGQGSVFGFMLPIS